MLAILALVWCRKEIDREEARFLGKSFEGAENKFYNLIILPLSSIAK